MKFELIREGSVKIFDCMIKFMTSYQLNFFWTNGDLTHKLINFEEKKKGSKNGTTSVYSNFFFSFS
jgi:hypothetical protein